MTNENRIKNIVLALACAFTVSYIARSIIVLYMYRHTDEHNS